MARKRKRDIFSDRGAGKARLVRRIILLSCACIGIFLTAGILAWYQLLAYLQGDTFRHKLCRELQSATHAESVSMRENLRINGNTIAQSELQLTGIGNISTVGAERILAHIERGELLDRKLRIRKLTMEEGNIVFRTESPGATASAPTATPAPSPRLPIPTHHSKQEPATAGSRPASVSDRSFMPNSFQLDFAECRDASITLQRGEKHYSLSGCNITARPVGKKKNWNIELVDGRLHTPFSQLKDTNLKTATLFCHDNAIDLTECRLMLTPGELRARASYRQDTEQWSGNLQLHKANISRLLKSDWQKRLAGELFGSCILRGVQNSLQHAEGSLSLRNGTLEGLPFLSELSIDNTRPYRRIELEKAECNIYYPYSAPERNLRNAWLFDKINIQSRGSTLLLRGHVIIADDGALGGQLTVGIPQHLAERLPLPGKRFTQTLFNGQGSPGYAWVNINLSGTVNSPEEDLSVRLSTLISREIPDAVLDSAGNMLRNIFDTSNKKKNSPTGSTPEALPPADTIINGASDLINRGIQTLF